MSATDTPGNGESGRAKRRVVTVCTLCSNDTYMQVTGSTSPYTSRHVPILLPCPACGRTSVSGREVQS